MFCRLKFCVQLQRFRLTIESCCTLCLFLYCIFPDLPYQLYFSSDISFYTLESTLAVNECNSIRSIERYHFFRLFKPSSITLFIMSKLCNHIMCPQWLWYWNHVPCISNYYICKSSAFVCISSYMMWENMKTVWLYAIHLLSVSYTHLTLPTILRV